VLERFGSLTLTRAIPDSETSEPIAGSRDDRLPARESDRELVASGTGDGGALGEGGRAGGRS